MQRAHIISNVYDELERAKKKWPAYYDDVIHAVGLVCEESGEAIQAALDLTYCTGSIQYVKNGTR